MKSFAELTVAIALAMAAVSCTQKNAPSDGAADPKQALIQRGRSVYQSNCTACHNTNPKQAGSIGPEVWGASLELLNARINSASYPAGYQPKRSTHAMAALPHLANEVEALHAYLNQ